MRPRSAVAAAGAALAAALAAGAALAGPPMESASNRLLRNTLSAGGETSTGSTQKIISAFTDDAAEGSSSSSHRLVSGAMAVFYYPGKASGLALSIPFPSSATLAWSTPGYDDALGPALQEGTSYYIRVASYTAPDTFSFPYAALWLSTGPAGTAPGASVAAMASGLHANATWYAEIWALDADGNLGFSSNRSTFTTLAVAPAALATAFLYVHETSVTARWAALPESPPDASSMSARGFLLEVSSTNFGALAPGGVVYSSATTSVLASTLTVDGLSLGATQYFRIGSLNWASVPHYRGLDRLNFQISQSRSELDLGALTATVPSVVSASSIVLTNVGNWPVTFRVHAATVSPGSLWQIAASTAEETVALQALWNSALPASSAFQDALLVSTQTSGGMGGLFAGDQAGATVPPGESRTMWFKFWLPTTTADNGPQTISVQMRAVYP